MATTTRTRKAPPPRKRYEPGKFACGYCGADPGDPCRVTLLPPERQILSVVWFHGARERAASGGAL